MAALLLFVSVGLIGCWDMEWDWETGRWYAKEQPGGAERRRVAPASRRGSARGRTADRKSAARSARSSTLPETTEAGIGGFYRLLLVSGPEAQDAPTETADGDMAVVQVTLASASQVGALLAELYPPVGPGGTTHRYYLVYQSSASMQAAASLAVQLDVGTEGIATGTELEPLEAFRAAVPLYYELTRQGSKSPLADEVLARLELAAGADQVADVLRWVSARLAGTIHADYRADPTAQKRMLLAARGVVPADSLEAFLAGAALADWYDGAGLTGEAEDLAKELAVEYQGFSGTVAYDHCLRLAKRQGN